MISDTCLAIRQIKICQRQKNSNLPNFDPSKYTHYYGTVHKKKNLSRNEAVFSIRSSYKSACLNMEQEIAKEFLAMKQSSEVFRWYKDSWQVTIVRFTLSCANWTDWMQQCNATLFRSESFTVCLDAEQRQTSKYFAQISVVIDIATHYHIFVMLVPSQSPGYNYDYD